MDLSLLPTPASEDSKQRTGARFTVRSANSPTYSLVRRSGVRKPRVFLEEEREGAQEVGERERYVMHTGTNGTNEKEDRIVTGYQARIGSRSSVKGQCEEKDTLGHKNSTELNQNDTADKTVKEFGADRSGNCNPASESHGRTDLRSSILPSRSNSLDWRKGERSPDWGKRADMFTLSTKRGGDASKWAGGLEERGTRAEGMRGRVMSSVQAYNTAGTSNDVQERSSLSRMSQTLDRASRGHSLPSRLRSQSGPGSGVRGTAPSFEPSGGQSILDRIEKLFGSAGGDFSTPLSSHHKETATNFLSLPQRRPAGGTFPRRFSSEEKSSPSPVKSRESFTWTQKDTSGSESYLSPGTSRTRERLSRAQWREQSQGRSSEEGGAHWSRGLEEIGTRSLDRARSRYTVAAQIRSARAAGEITAPPQPNTCLGEERSVSSRHSFGVRERRASGSKDEGRVNHGEEKSEKRTAWLIWPETQKETDDGAQEKILLKSSSTDEDVFESDSQTIRMKTIERKKFPEMLPVPSAASVKNKISQFEALTQRSQGLATGQVLMPRRAFSVPTQLSRTHEGVKNSGSAKAMSGLRDKWVGPKEGEEAGGKTEEKAAGAGGKFGSERSLSVDEVGLRSRRKEREGNDLVESDGKETYNSSAEGFDRYSRLKRTLEIPINEGAQRLRRQFYIDETDFSKVSSPEEGPPVSLLSNSTDTATGVQKTTPSPVSDEDKTPTNTPNRSPLLSPRAQPESTTPTADSESESTSVFTRAAKAPKGDSPPLPRPLATSSHSNLPDLISPDVNTAYPNRQQQVLDMDAWVAGSKIKVWNDNEDGYEDDDDDESTQKDEDSNYDSDSGESSVTITSNMSQSDRRSFCVSLSDLCNFAGVDYESENDSDEWQSTGRRTASLSSDISALSCVSVLPSEELDRLLEDVRSMGDNNLQDYDDVQVVVLHKDVGVGLGFSVAGGVDQNKPVTVHKVFPSGVAAQEGSIREGDQVLSINGTSLCGFVHWEALRVLRRAKTRDLGVVVLRTGGISSGCKGQTNRPGSTQTQFTETGQRLCVRLEKNSRDLGFSLEGGVGSSLENRPLTVQKIFQGDN